MRSLTALKEKACVRPSSSSRSSWPAGNANLAFPHMTHPVVGQPSLLAPVLSFLFIYLYLVNFFEREKGWVQVSEG